MSGATLFRAPIFHTPEANALEVFSDGGLIVEGERIVAVGDYAELQKAHPGASIEDRRGGMLLPGFVDTHVHYPQLRVIGALGQSLLQWLGHSALPEEARMAEPAYARQIAREFLHALASHGTTTALVFGAHFHSAMETLFDEALSAGLNIASGLVLSDRMLLPELHASPEEAYRQSSDLIRRYHGRGALQYAVTPRFAFSTSEAMLEICGALMQEHEGILFQTHINENVDEIEQVLRLFPWAEDYLGVYEKFGLVGARSVLAHNVWAADSTLQRMARSGASVAHCPCSNAALGSGFFSMRRHVAAGVRVSMGSDVGAGTGFGMLKEGLQAYLLQRLAPDCYPLTPAHLLHLITRAGADALGLHETGDLMAGRYADFVYVRPPEGSVLASVCRNSQSAEETLAAVFTLAGAESIAETWVRGRRVYKGAQ